MSSTAAAPTAPLTALEILTRRRRTRATVRALNQVAPEAYWLYDRLPLPRRRRVLRAPAFSPISFLSLDSYTNDIEILDLGEPAVPIKNNTAHVMRRWKGKTWYFLREEWEEIRMKEKVRKRRMQRMGGIGAQGRRRKYKATHSSKL